MTKPTPEADIVAAREAAKRILGRAGGGVYGAFPGDAKAVAEAFLSTPPAARGDEEAFDANVNRLKACEHIADGDEGWETLRNECPSTAAVARLRDQLIASRGDGVREVLVKACFASMATLVCIESSGIDEPMFKPGGIIFEALRDLRRALASTVEQNNVAPK